MVLGGVWWFCCFLVWFFGKNDRSKPNALKIFTLPGNIPPALWKLLSYLLCKLHISIKAFVQSLKICLLLSLGR